MKNKIDNINSRSYFTGNPVGSPSSREKLPTSTLKDKIKEKFLSFSFQSEDFFKALVCLLLLILFAMFQTTLFARFRPFGAIPDLILPFICAVSITEKEKWGAVVGIIGAFVIESLGGATVTLLPLLYMPVGYICGILSTYYFRDSISVRALYVVVSSVLRAAVSIIISLSTIGGISFLLLMKMIVLPEFICNVVFGLIPHYITKLCLRPFNKPREERVN